MFSQSSTQKSNIFLFLILFLAVSCSDDNHNPDPFQPVYLESADLVMSMTAQEIRNQIESSGLFPAEISAMVNFGVDAYRIRYFTPTESGHEVVASGALIIPQATVALPLLSFQHGTLTNPSEAPSLFQSEYTTMAGVFASMGYVLALPDYLGYGSTVHLPHPYEHRESLATATRDMIRASREFFLLEERPDDLGDKLFLTGYSEGGYATMAALELMQREHAEEFRITAATAGAGAYDKSAMAMHVISQNQPMNHMNTFMWVLEVYNRIYESLNRPWTHYLNEPWATDVAQGGPNVPLEPNPSLLFRAEFIEEFISGADQALNQVLADNDVYRWRPEFPLRLYHGTNDDLVFYFNSVNAIEYMQQAGAPNVALITVEGGNHASVVEDYLFGTLIFFMTR